MFIFFVLEMFFLVMQTWNIPFYNFAYIIYNLKQVVVFIKR